MMLNSQDLQRLVDLITEEVIAAQGASPAPPRQCGCHASSIECCPDRLRGVLDAGASRIGVHAAAARRAVSPD